MQTGFWNKWAEATEAHLDEPARQFDPEFMSQLVPKMEAFSSYFRAEVRGRDRVPPSPALLTGNHSGGGITPDTSAADPAGGRCTGFRRPADGAGVRRCLRCAWMARAHAEDRPNARQHGQRARCHQRRVLGAFVSRRLVRSVPTVERSEPHRLQRSEGLHPPSAQGRGSRGPGGRTRRTRNHDRPGTRRAFREAPRPGQDTHGWCAPALSAPCGGFRHR